MSDNYYLFDILANEKSMTVNMSIALNEASCDKLYKKYFSMFKDISETAKELYYLAYSNNWYKLEEAPKTKKDEELTKMETELTESSEN